MSAPDRACPDYPNECMHPWPHRRAVPLPEGTEMAEPELTDHCEMTSYAELAPILGVLIERAATFTDASETARAIAKRCRDKANQMTGDERKHWTAMAAGAQMVALKLTEQAAAAGAQP